MPAFLFIARFLFIAFFGIGVAPAFAQDEPTFSEQLACRSDAQQYCAEHIGKPPEMFACLRAVKQKLSESCRKVVEARGG